MSIFISKSDEFKIDFWVGFQAGKAVFFKTKEEALAALGEGNFQQHHVMCRPISYAASLKIQESSMRNDGSRLVFDPITFRSARFKKMMIGWSFTDSEGNAIPCNEEKIGSLSEDAAIFLTSLVSER
jgi:hypothetical protein